MYRRARSPLQYAELNFQLWKKQVHDRKRRLSYAKVQNKYIKNIIFVHPSSEPALTLRLDPDPQKSADPSHWCFLQNI